MGCWPSKPTPNEPYMPSFKVLNVPIIQPMGTANPPPSSTPLRQPTPTRDPTSPNPTSYFELPAAPPPSEAQDSTESDYLLHYHVASLPDTQPLQPQYRPYSPATRPQPSPLQHQHPVSLTPGFSPPPLSFPALSPLSHTTHISPPHPPQHPTQPYNHITYPPPPPIPTGMTLDDVLAPRGRRRWGSFRVAGRDMSVVRRERGDRRLEPERRMGR